MSSMLHWWTFVPCYTLVTSLRYLYIVTLELWHPTEVCFLDNPARHLQCRIKTWKIYEIKYIYIYIFPDKNKH